MQTTGTFLWESQRKLSPICLDHQCQCSPLKFCMRDVTSEVVVNITLMGSATIGGRKIFIFHCFGQLLIQQLALQYKQWLTCMHGNTTRWISCSATPTSHEIASVCSRCANNLATLRSLLVSSRWITSYCSANIRWNGVTYLRSSMQKRCNATHHLFFHDKEQHKQTFGLCSATCWERFCSFNTTDIGYHWSCAIRIQTVTVKLTNDKQKADFLLSYLW